MSIVRFYWFGSNCRVASFVYLHSTGPLAQTTFENGGIIDSAGTEVVEYQYDAWGRPIAKTGSLASTLGTLNPFRYRGYVYDEETNHFYILARYYSPIFSRFISPDSMEVILSNLTSLAERNLFTYCDNNPILRKDEEGKFWHIVVGGIIGAVISTAVQIVTNLTDGDENSKWYDGTGGALITGAISGGLSVSGIGLGASIASNAALNAVNSAVYDLVAGDGINISDVLIDGCIGAASGLAGGAGMGKTVKLRHLNRNLTKKLFSRSWNTFSKGIKYYVSQTKTYFTRLLYPAIRKAGSAALMGNIVNNHMIK